MKKIILAALLLITTTGAFAQSPALDSITAEIPLTLKAKNVYLIAYFLKGGNAEFVFSLLNKVKSATLGNIDLDDSVQVSVNIKQILSVIDVLGQQYEKEMAAPNRAIQESLVAQLMTLSAGPDGDIKAAADELLQELGRRQALNEASVARKIQAGREFVLSN